MEDELMKLVDAEGYDMVTAPLIRERFQGGRVLFSQPSSLRNLGFSVLIELR